MPVVTVVRSAVVIKSSSLQKAETRELLLMEQSIATPRSERSFSSVRSSNLNDEQLLHQLRTNIDKSEHVTVKPVTSGRKQYR